MSTSEGKELKGFIIGAEVLAGLIHILGQGFFVGACISMFVLGGPLALGISLAAFAAISVVSTVVEVSVGIRQIAKMDIGDKEMEEIEEKFDKEHEMNKQNAKEKGKENAKENEKGESSIGYNIVKLIKFGLLAASAAFIFTLGGSVAWGVVLAVVSGMGILKNGVGLLRKVASSAEKNTNMFIEKNLLPTDDRRNDRSEDIEFSKSRDIELENKYNIKQDMSRRREEYNIPPNNEKHDRQKGRGMQ